MLRFRINGALCQSLATSNDGSVAIRVASTGVRGFASEGEDGAKRKTTQPRQGGQRNTASPQGDQRQQQRNGQRQFQQRDGQQQSRHNQSGGQRQFQKREEGSQGGFQRRGNQGNGFPKREGGGFAIALKGRNPNESTTPTAPSFNEPILPTTTQPPRQYHPKKFSFAPSVVALEKEPELEVFDPPAYWNEDFPASFDDTMKHEVEKLEIFADFTMLMDSSWEQQIHPLFNGADIELILNAPLEDYDERLFMDDKTTYDTKVVMEVPLSCFHGLSPEGLEYVKQLAGPRYNQNKKKLKLTEDRYWTRVHNHKRLCDVLRDLTQTAHELSTSSNTTISINGE